MADGKDQERTVTAIRELFFKKYSEHLEADYDSRDVEMVRSNDKYLECFLSSTDSLDGVAHNLDLTLKLRKDFSLNDLTIDSFPKELMERNVIYWHGTNKNGNKILNFKVSHHKKGTYVEDLKKYLAYTFEQHWKEHMGEPIVVIFDFSGAALLNMDLDVVRFLIACLSTYFPSIAEYILLFEMPFLLSAVWRLIRGWLSEAQKKIIFQVNKNSIQEYIASDQLEDHMVKK